MRGADNCVILVITCCTSKHDWRGRCGRPSALTARFERRSYVQIGSNGLRDWKSVAIVETAAP